MNSMKRAVQTRVSYAVGAGRETLIAGAYFYPLKGILYLLSHPSLYGMIASRLVPTILMALAVTAGMFFFTYIPQAAVLTLLNGPLGVISAISLVLSESATITMMLARAFTLRETLTDLFDATLVSEGQDNLVNKGRELKTGRGLQGAHALGKNFLKLPDRSLLDQITNYVMLLPLNLVPLIGTALFLITQGSKTGPRFHTRYFQLKKLDEQQQNQKITEERGGYIGFGTAAVLLNLIPMGAIFFTLSSTVGAALWAADIERARYKGRVMSPRLTAAS